MNDQEKKDAQRRYERRIGNCQKDIKDLQRNNDQLREEIDRLKKAKEKMKTIESNIAWTARPKERNALAYKFAWKGQNWTDFDHLGDDIRKESSSYQKQTNHAIDCIRTEITNRENQLLRQVTIIGELFAEVNTLKTNIVNLFA